MNDTNDVFDVNLKIIDDHLDTIKRQIISYEQSVIFKPSEYRFDYLYSVINDVEICTTAITDACLELSKIETVLTDKQKFILAQRTGSTVLGSYLNDPKNMQTNHFIGYLFAVQVLINVTFAKLILTTDESTNWSKTNEE